MAAIVSMLFESGPILGSHLVNRNVMLVRAWHGIGVVVAYVKMALLEMVFLLFAVAEMFQKYIIGSASVKSSSRNIN